MKKSIVGVAAVLAAVLASGSVQAETKIKLMHTASAAYVSAFVAEDQGFFDKHGLDVELMLGSGSSALTAALLSDSVQIATIAPTVFFQAIENGLDLTAISGTMTYPNRGNFGVLARTGTDLKEAKDLIGKRVATPGIGGVTDVLFRKWLVDNGVELSQVNFVAVPFGQMSDLMLQGQIDAAISVDPFFARIVDADTGYLLADYIAEQPEGTITASYTATAAWAEANPEAVKAFQAAIEESIAFTEANHDLARESIARYTKLDPEVVASLEVPVISAKISADDLKFWYDLALDQDLIKSEFDYAAHLTPWMAD